MPSQSNKLEVIGATCFAVLLGLAALFFAFWRSSGDTSNTVARNSRELLESTYSAVSLSTSNSETPEEASGLPAPLPRRITAEKNHSYESKHRAQDTADTSAKIKRDFLARDTASTHLQSSPPVLEEDTSHDATLTDSLEETPAQVAHSEQHSHEPVATEVIHPRGNNDEIVNRHKDMLRQLTTEHANEMGNLKKRLITTENQATAKAEALAKSQAEVAKLRLAMESTKTPEPQQEATPALTTKPEQQSSTSTRSTLTPGSRELLARLDAVGDDPAKLRALYEGNQNQDGMKPATTVRFGSGSYAVSADKRKEIKNITAGATGDVRFLIVGYASMDGSAKANALLSNKRAEAVAREISQHLESPSNVEAIYYGQTKRFNAKALSPNRVVEIWQVH